MLEALTQNIPALLGATTGLIAVATTITKITPTKKDDAFLGKFILPILAIFSVLTKVDAENKSKIKVPIVSDIISAAKNLKK